MTPKQRLERALEVHKRLQAIAVEVGILLRDTKQELTEARDALLIEETDKRLLQEMS